MLFAWCDPAGAVRSDQEEHNARAALQQSLRNTVPVALDSLIGRDQSEKGVVRMYHMLQNPILLKSLFYIVLDLVIIQLLPEMAETFAGADCLR